MKVRWPLRINQMLDSQVQIEQALRDSEARLRLVVSQLPTIVWTTDADLRFTSGLGIGFQRVNSQPENVVGQTLFATFNTDDPQFPAIQGHRQALAGQSAVYELEWKGKVYQSHVEPLRDDAGRIIGCIGVALDVTDRKRAEQALQQREKYFRALIENSTDGIALLSADGDVTYMTGGLKPWADYSLDEIVGKNRFDLVHPEDVARVKEEWARLLEQPAATSTSEYRMRDKDGSWLWVERILHNLLLDPDIRAVVGNYRDITERKRAEEARGRSQELFRAMIENSTDGIVLLAADGTITYASAGANRISGYTTGEGVGKSRFALVHPDDLPQIREEWVNLLQRPGATSKNEYRVRHKNESWQWVERTLQNLLLDPNVGAVVSNYRDITERKLAEEAQRQYATRLEIQHEIDEAILAAQSLEEISAAVLPRVTALVASQEAHISLLDFKAREIIVYAGLRANAGGNGLLPGARIPFHELGEFDSILDRLHQGDVIVIDNVSARLRAVSNLQNWLTGAQQTAIVAPLRARGDLIGTLSLSADLPTQFSPEDHIIVREVANSLAVAIAQVRLFRDMSAARDRLLTLSRQLVEAQEGVRRQLAHDLHDLVGTNLTALSINLNVFRSELPGDVEDQREARLADSLKLLDETQDHIRGMMAELRPAILDDYGLEAALRWYARLFSSRTGLKVTVQGTALPSRLPPQAETGLFRISQEALTNIAKHAGATLVDITLESTEGMIGLIIADDGVGFDLTEQRELSRRRGLGLLSMAERAESFGGQFQVESAPGKGTRVIVEVNNRLGSAPDSSAS